MLEPEFVKWFATLGIGGVLAGFMFIFYRKDVKVYTELWKSTSDMLMRVIQDNTASNTKLITLIEALERRTTTTTSQGQLQPVGLREGMRRRQSDV